MALSDKTRRVLEVAMANRTAATELADAIDTGGNPVADNVAELGATADLTELEVTATDITASDFTAANAAEPTKAEIDAGIDAVMAEVETALDLKADNADVETLRTEVEDRLDAIEAKIDELLAAMVAAGQMEAP